MSGYYEGDERYAHDGDEQDEQTFQSTFREMLSGITQGQGHQMSANLWNSFLQVVVMFATSCVTANPTLGKVCVGLFAA